MGKTVQNLIEMADVEDKTDMWWSQNMHHLLFNMLH